jgi:sugar fermentation stimulation protein A
MLLPFSSPLVSGRLVRRYKRFLADVELEAGGVVTAHCANPGAMLGLNAAGARVWLSRSNKPSRKLVYSWELIEVDSGIGPTLVGINTTRPNDAAAAAIKRGFVPELAGYGDLRREVRYGSGCRIDILLSAPGRAPCYVEVKNVHLMRRAGLAEFPDSVTARGARHLAELAKLAQGGVRAVMLFLAQRGDAEEFALARDLDPAYARAFDAAIGVGVEAIALACALTVDGLLPPRRLPLMACGAGPAAPIAIAQGHISP